MKPALGCLFIRPALVCLETGNPGMACQLEQPPCFNTTRNGNPPHSGSRPDETRHFSECAASARPSRTCNAGPALARSSCSSVGEARSSGGHSAGLEAQTLRAVAPQDGRQSQRRVAQGGGRRDGCEKSRALRDNPLPWVSIDAYPEWIAALLSNTFLGASRRDRRAA